MSQLKRIIKEEVEESKAKAGLKAALDSICKEYGLEVKQEGDVTTLVPVGGEAPKDTGTPTGRASSADDTIAAYRGTYKKPGWEENMLANRRDAVATQKK